MTLTKKFYRDIDRSTGREVFKELGTDRYIGPTEFGKGAGFQEVRKPVVRRTESGGIEKYANSKLGSFVEQQKFKNLVKQVIQKKQDFNKDLQSSAKYWRTLQGDPMTFTNEKLRLLSPREQQAVREKAYSTAQAGLKGIADEERYRGSRVEDILSGLTAMQEARAKDAAAARESSADALNDEYKRLQILKVRESLGINPTISDIYGGFVDNETLRVGNKQGGSASWRNNNPGNIKFGKFAQKYGAKQGSKATDGGYFAAFPDVESGKKAMKDLLQSDAYKNLTLDAAMKRWSGGGYGADVLGYTPITDKMSEIIKDKTLFNDLVNAMVSREGWKEGNVLDVDNKEDGLEISDAKKFSLMEKAGLTQSDVKDYTVDDWVLLRKITREAVIEEAIEKARSYYNNKRLSAEEVIAKLNKDYNEYLDQADLNSIMLEAGFKPSQLSIFQSSYVR